MIEHRTHTRTCAFDGCKSKTHGPDHEYCPEHIPMRQSLVNAIVVQHYVKNPDGLKDFTNTLSEQQRAIARSHLQTYIKAQGEK